MVPLTPDKDDMSERLNSVERQNRNLTRVITMLCIAMGAAIVMAASVKKTISVVEAERFVLRDRSGAERANIGVGDSGGAGLVLYDRNRNPRVLLDIDSDGRPSLRLLNAGGENLYAAGGAYFDLSSVTFLEKNEISPRAQLSVVAGFPSVSLRDKEERGTIVLGPRSGGSSLAILDKTGKTVRQWP